MTSKVTFASLAMTSTVFLPHLVIANCEAVKQSRNCNDEVGFFSGLPRLYRGSG
ncbi:MAG: hypothetical protein LBE71_00920 [Dysgonamonadaceae bacterium]|nr:hypothetical protein [Dysgonamonadaceae bacterium]